MKKAFLVTTCVLLTACQISKAPVTHERANPHHGIFKLDKNQTAEVCPELSKGQTLSFKLTANQPVLFNFHYHQGDGVTYPIPERNLTTISYELEAPTDNSYCLMWKTHLDKTKVKYQYSIKH